MVYQKIKLNLKENSYDVLIGKNTSIDNSKKIQFIAEREILVVSDKNIPIAKFNSIYKSIIDCKPCKIHSLKLKLNEKKKNNNSVSRIHNLLINKTYSRNSLIICIGGGILSDVTGFAAATFLRGIDFMLIPSTLLSQVDASIGGKTGINHQKGKNLIGAFHQPRLVLIDINLLKSLPKSEVSEGYAEIIKHCLIKDKKLLNWLEKKLSTSNHLKDKDLIKLIYRSIKIKAEIVQQDETEKNLRALLNFGHTFGHAFEALGGFKTYSHGQGVSLGILVALEVSKNYYSISEEDITRIKRILKKVGLIIKPKTEISPDKVYNLMKIDKKRSQNSLKFILLNKLGSAVIKEDVPKKIVINALKQSFKSLR